MDFFTQLEKGRFGSFELKHQVGPNLLKGLLVSLLVHGSVFASPFIYRLLAGPPGVPEDPGVVIVLERPPLVPARPREKQVLLEPPPVGPAPEAVAPRPVDEEPTDPADHPLLPRNEDIPDYVPGPEDGNGAGSEPPLVLYQPPADEEVIPDTVLFIPFEEPPQALTDNPPPLYPELARTAGMPGKVVVQLFVDKAGRVRRWKVVQVDPQGVGFEDEVLKIVPEWRFTPAIQQGHPVGVWVAVPFKFELDR